MCDAPGPRLGRSVRGHRPGYSALRDPRALAAARPPHPIGDHPGDGNPDRWCRRSLLLADDPGGGHRGDRRGGRPLIFRRPDPGCHPGRSARATRSRRSQHGGPACPSQPAQPCARTWKPGCLARAEHAIDLLRPLAYAQGRACPGKTSGRCWPTPWPPARLHQRGPAVADRPTPARTSSKAAPSRTGPCTGSTTAPSPNTCARPRPGRRPERHRHSTIPARTRSG